ncbi:MAG TPA: RsmE family RNA methyltransferase [Candidatus Binataceae bacterium]|nr:RsmE family RNA methyltransferase [Candidatus Binataceae bacterium]
MNRPPRFAIDSPPMRGGITRVTGAAAHHMRDVMRLGPGAAVTLVDPGGARYEGVIARCDRGGVEVRVSTVAPAAARARLVIAPAIIKGPRMDFIVEKAAELGATELWPILCERGVARAPGAERLGRWRRLADAASRQSLVAPAMAVGDAIQFADLIRSVPRDTLGLICAVGAEPMGAILARERPRGIVVACGPEGDFTGDELKAAAREGMIAAGLGPNRLRSETAAIAALAIAAQWLERAG